MHFRILAAKPIRPTTTALPAAHTEPLAGWPGFKHMNWNPLTQPDHLNDVLALSTKRLQVVLKHSTRCSISAMAKSRLERQFEAQPLDADFHLLLVVEDRAASNHVAQQLQVQHESPQLIALRNHEVVLDQSHYDIQLAEVAELMRQPA